MDVEKLIELVRGHVFLYDLSHHHYKNAALKCEIWKTIGRDMNETDEAVRSKWKTIRDGYTKYKKQLKSSRGSGKKNINYTWAPQLAFLDNVYSPRGPLSKVQLDATQPYPNSQTSALDSENSQDPPPLPSTSSSSQVPLPSQVLLPESPANTSTASTSRLSCRNNKRSSENSRNDDDVGSKFEFLNAKKKKEYDVIDNLFLSYAHTFKKFPPREQAIVKLELAQLFSNIELQLLNNNSNDSDCQYTSTASSAYVTHGGPEIEDSDNGNQKWKFEIFDHE